VNDRFNPMMGRRVVLHGLIAGTVAAVAPLSPVRADTESDSEKRKARYQPDSPEVQTFYRVNRYPAA
jgi:hypothetical protein